MENQDKTLREIHAELKKNNALLEELADRAGERGSREFEVPDWNEEPQEPDMVLGIG